MLTFFSRRNTGGSKGGDTPLGGTRARASATSRYSAFLCLLSFLAKTGDRGESPGGTRARQAPRPVTPLFFAYFLFSQKHGGSKGGAPGGTRPPEAARPVTPLFFAYLLFSQKHGGIQGGRHAPWRDKGAGKRHVPLLRFSLLTFFSRENGGPGGIPRRDKGAASATSCYSAFLCLLSFLAETRGIQGGSPRRDKAARGGTSRYSAFLCLLSFLAKRK